MPSESNTFTPEQQKLITDHLAITKKSLANKNYLHVPCKFFKQGKCQAGGNCPFSHELHIIKAANAMPCKYYQKGNCKFGASCVNSHIDNRNTILLTPPDSSNFGQFDEFEEYYIPSECSELLNDEELKRRKLRSYSNSSPINYFMSPSSSVSSVSSTSNSFKHSVGFPNKWQFDQSINSYTPHKPTSNYLTNRRISNGNDLTIYKIKEEDEYDLFSDRNIDTIGNPTNEIPIPVPVPILLQQQQQLHYNNTNTDQDTQFLFDDIPNYYHGFQ